MPDHDPVDHPAHYTSHPSGIECIEVVEHFGFNLGNAIKYLWRADEKGNAVEDLRKAAWYVAREIDRRSNDALRLANIVGAAEQAGLCGDVDPVSGMLCTRRAGHEGQHHAQTEPAALPIARWTR